EKMAARELSDLMHRYFESTFEPIRQNGGLVIELKGDSILALWKAARPDARIGGQACAAALGLADAVARFNQTLAGLTLPTRIAVHAGEIFLGNIGAGDHYEYGITGDTVNTVSRLDGLNKFLGTGILVPPKSAPASKIFSNAKPARFCSKANPSRSSSTSCWGQRGITPKPRKMPAGLLETASARSGGAPGATRRQVSPNARKFSVKIVCHLFT